MEPTTQSPAAQPPEAPRQSYSLPALSVIILVPDDGCAIKPLLRHLQRQTVKDRLEIVLVAIGSHPLTLQASELAGFHSTVEVIRDRTSSSAIARAEGVVAASAPLVALTEDHSLPEAIWAAELIAAHQVANRAVVGPAVVNGNPGSLVSRANFTIEYHEWTPPLASGRVAHLPGHNSCYKRQVLLSYGDRLGRLLESESVLHWELARKGYELFLQTSARTRHFNFSLFLPSLGLRFHSGRLFAGQRRLPWPLAKRVLYTAAAPLIPIVRFVRIFRQYRRLGGDVWQLPPLLFLVFLLLIFDGCGEMFGYLLGAGRSIEKITAVDFFRERYMRPGDQAEYNLMRK